MTQAVVCNKCGATFRNRRFWALQSSGDVPRKRCPRCAAKGPFREATHADIAAFSKEIGTKLGIMAIFELAGYIILFILAAHDLFK